MSASPALDVLPAWYAQLEERHLSSLSFQEVRRGAEALSATYVARGTRLQAGRALEGRGKRAAFALLYGPLHFVMVAHVVAQLKLGSRGPLLDVGCGTGVAGAAWALSGPSPRPPLMGVDTNAWAIGEARWNWRTLGLVGQAKVGRAEHTPLTAAGGIVAAFVLNEWPDAVRERFVQQLIDAHKKGAAVLVLEPIARDAAPFWRSLCQALEPLGAAVHEHRIRPALPERLTLLRRASKREARELTARSLSLPGR